MSIVDAPPGDPFPVTGGGWFWAAAPGFTISIVAHCGQYPVELHGLALMLFVISRADAGGWVGFVPRDHARQKDAKPQEDAGSLPDHLLRALSPACSPSIHRANSV